MKTATVGCNNNASGSEVHVCLRQQHTWNSGGFHPFTGDPCGLRIQGMPYANKDSTLIILFLLLFMEVFQLLVAGTYEDYSPYSDTFDNNSRNSWLLDMTVQKMYLSFDHNSTNWT
jgi:hypothetical protein